MHSNYASNCYSDLCCKCCNFYNIPTSSYCSQNCCFCCCCHICQQVNKPKSKLPIKMLSKKKATGGAASSSKNSAKLKNKTVKVKKNSGNGKEENNQSHDIQTSKRQEPFSGGLNDENALLRTSSASARTSNVSLKNSGSFCQYQCSCKPLKICNSKQRLNLDISFTGSRSGKYPVYSECGSHGSATSQNGRENFKALENTDDLPNDVLTAKIPQYKRSGSDIQLRKCHCCRKTSATNLGSSKSSRHSFSSTKSCPQLDVIDEEDSETGITRRQYKAVALENENSQSYVDEQLTSDSNKTKVQKSLEDSCADFLTIVCDNVMECVQNSLDCRLKEFRSQATDDFQCLRQKLEDNEATMKHLFKEMLENMTEQNKINFGEFYLRIQELVENQNQARQDNTQSKECQYEEPDEEGEPPHEMGNVQDLPNATNEACHNDGNVIKCEYCDCCFEEESSCHPCCRKENENETSFPPTQHDRETAGGLHCGETQVTPENAEVKVWQPYVKSGCATRSETDQGFPESRNSSAQVFKNFHLASSGKTISNGNSAQHCWQGAKVKKKLYTPKIVNVTCNKILNGKNLYDNYDTSGYATEPEDNSEDTAATCSRKKVQKKTLKIYRFNRQTSGGNLLENRNFNASDTHNDVSEKSSNQTIRRSSRSSLRSCVPSPTRLSRL